jgi:DNA-binding transcriptional ArsR family regulator
MDVDHAASAVAAVALAIGEPARARMLACLLDGHARTGTELAAVGEVTASTASAHVKRLVAADLVSVVVQGRHRYYRLAGPTVARALEMLTVVATGAKPVFVPTTPSRLRVARTCYDHLAGTLGVLLHDRVRALGWITIRSGGPDYDVTPTGTRGFHGLGVDVPALRTRRRKFACACLDWSERRPHLGGALGAAMLNLLLERKWVATNRYDRALDVTAAGRKSLQERLGIATTVVATGAASKSLLE